MSRAAPVAHDVDVSAPGSIVVTAGDSSVTLRVSGELDQASWPGVERAMMACLAVDAARVDLDLAGVSFISSSACRQLHHAITALRDARRCVVVTPSRPLTRVVALATAAGMLPDDAPAGMSA